METRNHVEQTPTTIRKGGGRGGRCLNQSHSRALFAERATGFQTKEATFSFTRLRGQSGSCGAPNRESEGQHHRPRIRILAYTFSGISTRLPRSTVDKKKKKACCEIRGTPANIIVPGRDATWGSDRCMPPHIREAAWPSTRSSVLMKSTSQACVPRPRGAKSIVRGDCFAPGGPMPRVATSASIPTHWCALTKCSGS